MRGATSSQQATATTRTLEAIGDVEDEDIRARSHKALRDVLVWGSSVTLDGPFEKIHVELHTARENDAKDLEDVVERFVKERRREAREADEAARDTDDASEKPSDDAPPEAVGKLARAVRSLRWHAYDDATIEQKGEVVTIDCDDRPTDADKALWKTVADANKERAKHAASILDAIAAGQDPSEDDEKALSARLAAILHPPESVALDGFGDFRIPGGGTCYVVDESTQSCAFAKWDKPTAVDKLKTQVQKAGFSFTPDATSDASFVAKKDAAVVAVAIFASHAGGAHVTVHLTPPAPKAH